MTNNPTSYRVLTKGNVLGYVLRYLRILWLIWKLERMKHFFYQTHCDKCKFFMRKHSKVKGQCQKRIYLVSNTQHNVILKKQWESTTHIIKLSLREYDTEMIYIVDFVLKTHGQVNVSMLSQTCKEKYTFMTKFSRSLYSNFGHFPTNFWKRQLYIIIQTNTIISKRQKIIAFSLLQ